MKIKVSVVLPIYNVEQYLERCINSVVNQTYTNLEIILVDDGSPDNCPQMCEDWKKRDSRIKVVHKKNAGLGMARNSGIEAATGEYICFFDSDDYVKRDIIEKCVRIAKSKHADIVIYGFSDVNPSGEIIKTMVPTTKKDYYCGDEVQNTFLPDLIAPNIVTGEKSNLWMSAWCSFYSMELIKKTNWRFVSEREIISEDIYSLLDLYKNVNSVCVINEALYLYCMNSTSLTHIFKPDRFERIKIFYDECLQIAKKHKYNRDVINRLSYQYISNTMAALKLVMTSSNHKDEKKAAVYRILMDPHLKAVIRSSKYPKDSIRRKVFMTLIKYRLYTICYMILYWINKK